jgi:hypothetical protein
MTSAVSEGLGAIIIGSFYSDILRVPHKVKFFKYVEYICNEPPQP